MTQSDKQEIRELITDIMSGSHARTEAKYDVIDNKLDGINTHLENLNGKVADHERRLNDDDINHASRETSCPFREDIVDTKKQLEFKRKLNKWLIGALVVLNIILGMSVAVISVINQNNKT